MALKLYGLMRGIDAFVHDTKVNYRRVEQFNSSLGGCLNLVFNALKANLCLKWW